MTRSTGYCFALLWALVWATPATAQVNNATPRAVVFLPAGSSFAGKQLAAEVRLWYAQRLVTRVLNLAATGEEKPGFSSLALLEMPDEAAWGRWQKTQMKRLPADVRVRRVDALVRGADFDVSAREAVFEVNVYRLMTKTARYQKFCVEYVVPLMQGQVDAGLMTAYAMFLERGEEGDRNVVLVKAYRDRTAWQQSADFKTALREKLAAQNEAYPKWHAVRESLGADVSQTLAASVPRK